MMKLNREMVNALFIGSSFLATGGGGSPYLGELFAYQTLLEGFDLNVVALNELPDTATIVCIGCMGAPEIAYEKIPSLKEGILAFQKMQDFLGRKIDAIIPMEMSGFKALFPVSIAAQVGVPVIDSDGMVEHSPALI